MKRKIYNTALLFLLCLGSIYSQQKETTYRSEIFGSASTGENTPFWMLNHTWGMTPLDANNFYIRGAVFHNQQINEDYSFKLGFDMAGSSPHSYNTIWVQQIFGELNWKHWRLNIGSKEDYNSFLDENLSSGDFSLSNNARPAPEFKISLSDFVPIPYTNNKLYLRGDFALGKYLDGDYQEDVAKPHNQIYMKNALSHHKSLFFRLGNFDKNDQFRFTFGGDHHAQWGGQRFNQGNVRENPAGFSDFIRVLAAMEGGSNAPGGDKLYVAGSHVGSYTFKLDHRLNNKDELSVYWHHFFEDGSGMTVENYRDMLLGFQYKANEKKLLSNILFEYIYTKHQTGPIHFNLEMNDEYNNVRNKGNGMDDYYNNYDHIQGRSYFGRSLGTPLLLSPEYNKDGRLHFKSNRIIAFHLTFEGYLHRDISYRLLLTQGETWGRYKIPYVNTKKGIASTLDLKYSSPKIDGFDVKLSVGFDQGEFFQGNTFGAGISLVKRGTIFSR